MQTKRKRNAKKKKLAGIFIIFTLEAIHGLIRSKYFGIKQPILVHWRCSTHKHTLTQRWRRRKSVAIVTGHFAMSLAFGRTLVCWVVVCRFWPRKFDIFRSSSCLFVHRADGAASLFDSIALRAQTQTHTPIHKYHCVRNKKFESNEKAFGETVQSAISKCLRRLPTLPAIHYSILRLDFVKRCETRTYARLFLVDGTRMCGAANGAWIRLRPLFPKAFLSTFMFIQSIFGVFVSVETYTYIFISNVWATSVGIGTNVCVPTCGRSKRSECHQFRILIFAFCRSKIV